MKKFIFMLTILFSVAKSSAYEVKNICAKYQTNYSWSKSQNVQVSIFSGQELNKIIGGYPSFSYAYHYAVIWWDNGQASIIKMNIYFPGMMLYESEGIDQNGRHWRLSDNNMNLICF